jgi:hypothetical protein
MQGAEREPSLILVGQFLIGVGIGIDFPASGSYVSEIMPRSLRSRDCRNDCVAVRRHDTGGNRCDRDIAAARRRD